MATPPGPFDYERHSLRWILDRLMGENQDLETLCKHVPKLASTIATIARAEAVLTSSKPPEETDAVRKALRDLMEERMSDQEETQW